HVKVTLYTPAMILNVFTLAAILALSLADYPADIRIAGGGSSGRVEVFYNNVWGTICSDSWDDSAAGVICRGLGYSSGSSLDEKHTISGSGPIWLDDVQCDGSEMMIDSCKHEPWGVNDCTHSLDAGVTCWGSYQIDVRLTDGTIHDGLVEVYFNYEWGAICQDSWTNTEAQVVCRMLGYSHGYADASRPSSYRGKFWMDKVDCTGQELSLGLCSHYPWGTVTCKHGQEARVRCDNLYKIDGRVVGSKTEGRVEVLYDNKWGTVCANPWDDEAATVFCRMNGYLRGLAIKDTRVSPGSGTVWLSNVKCNGSEVSIAECNHSHWGLNTCSHSQDAGVRCIQESPVSVRLSNGSSGRVEVFFYNHWGTVCDDNWTAQTATVVCKMLGFRKGNVLEKNIPGSGRIWLDDVKCTGIESSIKDCKHRSWGSHDCSHSEDVTIECYEALFQNVRIIGGTAKGRVEVYHNGEWGTICDDGWSNKAAIVVCKSLGFRNGKAIVGRKTADGSGKIWLDEVKCSGAEKTLLDCNHDPWGQTDCKHDEDAGIECFNRLY
ncbi:in malignant brain tumors 1 neurotrypsin-like, partial [Argonauta hians]